MFSARYPFTVRSRADDYLDNLATQSGTRALGDDRAHEFLGRVRTRLETMGVTSLTRTLVARLIVGRLR